MNPHVTSLEAEMKSHDSWSSAVRYLKDLSKRPPDQVEPLFQEAFKRHMPSDLSIHLQKPYVTLDLVTPHILFTGTAHLTTKSQQ